jgi:DNA polymerase-3 subunit beta
MNKMFIPYGSLKACSIVAPKADVRFYLRGVLIDVREHDVTLVATNGHVLIAIPVATDEPPPVGKYIVPLTLLKAVKPISKNQDEVEVTITGASVSLRGATTVSGELVDGSFPDWRQAIPKKASGVVAQFDPLVIARIADALAAMGVRYPVLHYNGTGGCRVTSLDCDAIGAIMPLRIDAPFTDLPPWAA